MRMRLKKHLDERIEKVAPTLLYREGDLFYALTADEKEALRIDLSETFGNDRPTVLEIGCGKGGWVIKMAKLYPELNFVAVEKLSNVIVVACELAQKEGLNNVKFLNVRAENLGWYLPPNSVTQIALNFSCPFPKKTYANRRLTSRKFLELYKTLLLKDGFVSQKTDNRAFFDWSAESFTSNGFELFDVCCDLPQEQSVVTEYEAKFRAENKPIYALKARISQQ